MFQACKLIPFNSQFPKDRSATLKTFNSKLNDGTASSKKHLNAKGSHSQVLKIILSDLLIILLLYIKTKQWNAENILDWKTCSIFVEHTFLYQLYILRYGIIMKTPSNNINKHCTFLHILCYSYAYFEEILHLWLNNMSFCLFTMNKSGFLWRPFNFILFIWEIFL